jgi:hypothetical protein
VEEVVLQAKWDVEKLRHLNRDVRDINFFKNFMLCRLGIVRYHVTGTKYDDDIICIKAIDFETWVLGDYVTVPPLCETLNTEYKE